MTLRPRFLRFIDKVLAGLIVLAVTGTALAFGGAVWWARPALALVGALMLAAWLARSLALGRWIVLKSPLTFLGLLALGIAVVQLAPLPGRLATSLSPRARAVHALGTLPDRAKDDDPDVVIPEVVADRTPATLDRSATLRWLLGAVLGLSLFCVSSHFADRWGHAAVIWGSVVAAFFVATTFGLVQLTGGVSGLYGAIEPGSGRPGMPTREDLAAAPGSGVLRPVGEANAPGSAWSLPRAGQPFLFGPLMGGPGAYLALGALGLPLALGLSLQLLAPRGSRQGMRARLRESGRTGLLAMMLLLTLAGAALVGTLAGPLLAAPFALGLALAGLPGAWTSGLRWTSVGLTVAALGALGGGVLIGDSAGGARDGGPRALADLARLQDVAREAARIARDFPILGSGLGTYPVLAPYYKTTDASFNTARSSLLQWWVESGLVGVALLGVAGLWCLGKLPGATRRVGSADRTLAFMLIGTAVCFGAFSLLHWTVELAAVGLAACAVGGTLNRWLAGGTDLFVEPA